MLVIPARQAADYEHLAYYFYEELKLRASFLGLELPPWDDLPYELRRAYELTASEYIPHPCDESDHQEEVDELQSDLDKAESRSSGYRQIIDDYVGGELAIGEAKEALTEAQSVLDRLENRFLDIRDEVREVEDE